MAKVSNYFIWEHAEFYTNYGITDAWMVKKEYDLMKRFDSGITFSGMLGGKSYYDKPRDMVVMENPSSKVVKMTYRQNLGQDPRTAFYNPMHILCKTNGQLVYAKDLKPGDLLVSIFSEVRVEYVELFDQEKSGWYILTTEGMSPNIFVNLLLTFPTSLENVSKYEDSLRSLAVSAMEYEGEDPIIQDITEVTEVVGPVDTGIIPITTLKTPEKELMLA